MKRILFIIPLIILMASCSVQPAAIQKEFKAEITANYNKIKIKADVISAGHSLKIEIKSPDNLNGYVYSYKSSDLSVKYGDLILNTEYNYIPVNAFSSIIYNVLEAYGRDELNYIGKYNTKARFSGKCESGNFIISSDYNTGYISEIEIKDLNFKAEFK